MKIFAAVKSSHDDQSELSAKHLLWVLDFRGSGLYEDHMVTESNDGSLKSGFSQTDLRALTSHSFTEESSTEKVHQEILNLCFDTNCV